MFLYYCRYPTDMYEDILDGIVSEYPYLLTSGGLPATSARERERLDTLLFIVLMILIHYNVY